MILRTLGPVPMSISSKLVGSSRVRICRRRDDDQEVGLPVVVGKGVAESISPSMFTVFVSALKEISSDFLA
eukprot:2206321-Pleurochrysis_carterae.AAC.1